MAKRNLCRAEIQELIGYTIEIGSIMRVMKNDLLIHMVVTKISRGWYQGLKVKIKPEELEGCVVNLSKAKDVVYAMPTGYPQYVGVSKELIKGIRKENCVGSEGYIVGKVLNKNLLKIILKAAKMENTIQNIYESNEIVFEDLLVEAEGREEVLSRLKLDRFSILKKAVIAAMERKDGSMKAVLEELQKDYPKMKRSEIKREINADLSIWINENHVEMKESTISYILQKIANVV